MGFLIMAGLATVIALVEILGRDGDYWEPELVGSHRRHRRLRARGLAGAARDAGVAHPARPPRPTSVADMELIDEIAAEREGVAELLEEITPRRPRFPACARAGPCGMSGRIC